MQADDPAPRGERAGSESGAASASYRVVVSICSPVHNEESNLSELISRVTHAMDGAEFGEWEYILVDDGSSDRSAEWLSTAADCDSRIRVLRHQVNQGERAAWRTALHAAEGEVVCIVAADLQSPPEELPKLIRAVLVDGFDVGTGRRKLRQDGAFYLISTWILTQFSRVLWGVKVRDVSSSFFAVRRKFVHKINLIKNDHRYIMAIFARHGATIKEVDTEHLPRIHGASHYSRMKVVWAIPEVALFSWRLFGGFYD